MGTSSIFDGPVTSLLPDDYDETPDSEDEKELPQTEEEKDSPEDEQDTPDVMAQLNAFQFRWKDAKTAMTSYVKGRGSYDRALSRYLSASGGSKQLAHSSVSGRRAAISIGRLIQNFQVQGVVATLRSLQIDCVGKSVRAVLSEIVNVIAENSDSKEDIVARQAANEAVAEMYKIISDNDGDIEALRNIDESTFRNIIEAFMSEYIFARVMSDLQSRFEKYEDNPRVAMAKEQDLREYISVKVELRVRELRAETMDYSSSSVVDEIDYLFTKCYQAFESYV